MVCELVIYRQKCNFVTLGRVRLNLALLMLIGVGVVVVVLLAMHAIRNDANGLHPLFGCLCLEHRTHRPVSNIRRNKTMIDYISFKVCAITRATTHTHIHS